jgi:hypothetical protein
MRRMDIWLSSWILFGAGRGNWSSVMLWLLLRIICRFKVTSWKFEYERYVCVIMQRLVLLQN